MLQSLVGRTPLRSCTFFPRSLKDMEQRLYALTIDEGIEGYREEAVKNAKELAAKLSVPLLVSSYKEFFGHTLDSTLQEREPKGS